MTLPFASKGMAPVEAALSSLVRIGKENGWETVPPFALKRRLAAQCSFMLTARPRRLSERVPKRVFSRQAWARLATCACPWTRRMAR